YMDYLEEASLLTQAASEYNTNVAYQNALHAARREKMILCNLASLFVDGVDVSTVDANLSGDKQKKEIELHKDEVGASVVDRVSNGRVKFIIEPYEECCLGTKTEVFNTDGSEPLVVIGNDPEQVNHKKVGGVLSMEAFNHFLCRSTEQNREDKVLLTSTSIVVKTVEDEDCYFVYSYELKHSRASKFFFLNFKNEFPDVQKTFMFNHWCFFCQTFVESGEQKIKKVDEKLLVTNFGK
ncbi:hypothetical protein EIN_391100, partial [Entamoeba invadens IP1]